MDTKETQAPDDGPVYVYICGDASWKSKEPVKNFWQSDCSDPDGVREFSEIVADDDSLGDDPSNSIDAETLSVMLADPSTSFKGMVLDESAMQAFLALPEKERQDCYNRYVADNGEALDQIKLYPTRNDFLSKNPEIVEINKRIDVLDNNAAQRHESLTSKLQTGEIDRETYNSLLETLDHEVRAANDNVEYTSLQDRKDELLGLYFAANGIATMENQMNSSAVTTLDQGSSPQAAVISGAVQIQQQQQSKATF